MAKKRRKGIKVDFKKLEDYQKAKKPEVQLQEAVMSVKDTDMFFLFRLNFNCSDNKGARSINKVSMNKLLDKYEELGDKAEEVSSVTGIRLIDTAINDEFKLSILDRILKIADRKNLPSHIKETFISAENYNLVQRIQNRFTLSIANMGYPFRLGDAKNSTFFYVLSNDEYQKIVRPITKEEIKKYENAMKSAADGNKDPLDALIMVMKPYHLESLQYVLEKVKARIRRGHSRFFFGNSVSTILNGITITKSDLPQYKPALNKTNEHLQALYLALQNTLITNIMGKLTGDKGKLTDKNINSINVLIKHAEKVNILGDPGLLEMVKEIRLKLKEGNEVKMLSDYIAEQNTRIKRKSGVKVSFKKV